MQAMSPPQAYQPAMTSYAQYQQQQAYRPGTLPPGVTVGIGEYVVTIERFLSEGGFAHVYLVYSQEPIPRGSQIYQHVLKRVAVPDKETLKEVRWEVDVMKLVRGHKHIVNLIEASATPIPGTAGYEVFILMEYAPGGGIIDMMNTRLQNRLTEQEILKIFGDVVEAVCWMHTRDPPLIHRDLKVENILLAGKDLYKLCDFGSSTIPKPRPPQNTQEIQALEAELNKHTTLQYRAPEMCDVWSRKGVGLPADIWALGVLLYKLCFYITPFEEQGPLAILNVQYSMPAYPAYSQALRDIIATMLVESASMRPTAYQVHEQVCRLQGVAPNTSYRVQTPQSRSSAPSPAFDGSVTPSNLPSRPTSQADNVLRQMPTSTVPQAQLHPATAEGISPMRRGRPTKLPHTPSSTSVASTASTSSAKTEWAVADRSTAASPAVLGFGDSFDPAAAPTDTAVSPTQDSNSQQAGSITDAATAALFEELSNPRSAVKGPPTLASLAAARQNGGGKPQAFGGSAPAYPSSASTTFGPRKVTPTKPLGPRPPPASSMSQPQQSQATIQPQASSTSTGPPTGVSATSNTTPQLEAQSSGQQTAPADHPSRQMPSLSVLPPKPKMVSRGSQTSPTLLNDWKRRESDNLMRLSTQAHLSSSSQASATEKPVAEPERFPSIDEWESTGFSPPPSSEQGSATALQPASQQSLPAIDLLSVDDEQQNGENGDKTVGQNIDMDAAEGESALEPTGQTPQRSLSVKSMAASMSNSSTPAFSPNGDSPREKFKPVKKESPVLQRQLSAVSNTSTASSRSAAPVVASPAPMEEEESSDDEPASPEAVTGQRYGRTTPKQQTSIESTSTKSPEPASGTFDVQPALASIQKFAPKPAGRPPPVLAPKPKYAGISSAVSRYESISAKPPSRPSTEQSQGSVSSKPEKPIKPPKPGSLPSASSTEDFDARFPALDNSEQTSPTASSGGARRQPFKPSRENSSQSISSMAAFSPPVDNKPRARPQSMYMPSQEQTSKTTSAAGTNGAQAATQEEEDGGFKGVASLRDRWQKGISSQQPANDGASGLNRRSTVASRWTNRAQ